MPKPKIAAPMTICHPIALGWNVLNPARVTTAATTAYSACDHHAHRHARHLHREQIAHRRRHAEAAVLQQDAIGEAEPHIDQHVDEARVLRQGQQRTGDNEQEDPHRLETAFAKHPMRFSCDTCRRYIHSHSPQQNRRTWQAAPYIAFIALPKKNPCAGKHASNQAPEPWRGACSRASAPAQETPRQPWDCRAPLR